jgi:hypothetical protein
MLWTRQNEHYHNRQVQSTYRDLTKKPNFKCVAGTGVIARVSKTSKMPTDPHKAIRDRVLHL